MTVLVVIACHFKSRTGLCDTTIARLEKALALYRASTDSDVRLICGGNVPYEKGGATLQTLMRRWLISRGVDASKVLPNRGTGTFSEARETLKQVCELHACCGRHGCKIVVVSSSWWLWSGKPVWNRFARNHRSFAIQFAAICGTGGWHTFITYAVYALVVYASFLTGTSSLVERRLNAMQTKRLEEFTWNGCA